MQHQGAFLVGGGLVAVGQAAFVVLRNLLLVRAPQALLDAFRRQYLLHPGGSGRAHGDGAIVALGKAHAHIAHALGHGGV